MDGGWRMEDGEGQATTGEIGTAQEEAGEKNIRRPIDCKMS